MRVSQYSGVKKERGLEEDTEALLMALVRRLVADQVPIRGVLARLLKEAVLEALRRHPENMSEVARSLGVHRSTLWNYRRLL
jgi:transcriptional regulator of acetoin/glycerol metabolism